MAAAAAPLRATSDGEWAGWMHTLTQFREEGFIVGALFR